MHDPAAQSAMICTVASLTEHPSFRLHRHYLQTHHLRHGSELVPGQLCRGPSCSLIDERLIPKIVTTGFGSVEPGPVEVAIPFPRSTLSSLPTTIMWPS